MTSFELRCSQLASSTANHVTVPRVKRRLKTVGPNDTNFYSMLVHTKQVALMKILHVSMLSSVLDPWNMMWSVPVVLNEIRRPKLEIIALLLVSATRF